MRMSQAECLVRIDDVLYYEHIFPCLVRKMGKQRKTSKSVKSPSMTDRRNAYEQALSSARVEGYTPTAEELADGDALVNGAITADEFRRRSAQRSREIEKNNHRGIADAA